MTGLELIFDYFEDHVRAAAHVNESRPLVLGTLCFMIGGLSLFVFHALQGLVFFSFSWSSLAMVLILKVLAGFLMTAILHMILDLSGAKGSAASLFVLLGLASLTWAVSVPLALLARLFFHNSSLAPGAIFAAVGLLSLSLKARSLQDNYQIRLGRAWVSLMLPYLGLLVAGLMMFALAIAGLVFQIVRALH